MFSMFVAVMGFFARISDPLIGGTNMTLLNTLTNLGTAWANTVALWMTDFLTYKQCSNNADNTCSTEVEVNVSKSHFYCKHDCYVMFCNCNCYVIECFTNYSTLIIY